jgi:hypothetical protein
MPAGRFSFGRKLRKRGLGRPPRSLFSGGPTPGGVEPQTHHRGLSGIDGAAERENCPRLRPLGLLQVDDPPPVAPRLLQLLAKSANVTLKNFRSKPQKLKGVVHAGFGSRLHRDRSRFGLGPVLVCHFGRNGKSAILFGFFEI